MSEKEELKSTKQLKLVNRALAEISKENMNLYYEPTETIAHLIYEYFQKELGGQEKELIKDLSPDDILIKLSLHNS